MSRTITSTTSLPESERATVHEADERGPCQCKQCRMVDLVDEALAAAAEYAKANTATCEWCLQRMPFDAGKDICDNCRRAYWHGKRSVEMPGAVIADAALEPIAHAPDCGGWSREIGGDRMTGTCTCGALDRAKLLRDVKAVTDGDAK